MRARCVEVAVAVGRERRTATCPGIVVLGLVGVLHPILNVLKNLGIARAKVALGQRNAAVTDVPRITVRLHVARPLANHFEILILTRGKQEQHADAREPFLCVGLRKIIGDLPHDLVRLRAVQRPRFAIGTQHGHLDRDRLDLAANDELQRPVLGLRLGEDVT